MDQSTLCEVCQGWGVEEPGVAVATVHIHEAFANAECREVLVCQECLDQGVSEDRRAGCPGCKGGGQWHGA